MKWFVNHLPVKGFINQNILRASKTQTYGRRQHSLTKWAKGFNTLQRIQCMINIMLIKRCSILSLEKFKFKQQWDIITHLFVWQKSDKTNCWQWCNFFFALKAPPPVPPPHTHPPPKIVVPAVHFGVTTCIKVIPKDGIWFHKEMPGRAVTENVPMRLELLFGLWVRKSSKIMCMC